jgi:short subunit dehydrogenase-like uncharacterized protein
VTGKFAGGSGGRRRKPPAAAAPPAPVEPVIVGAAPAPADAAQANSPPPDARGLDPVPAEPGPAAGSPAAPAPGANPDGAQAFTTTAPLVPDASAAAPAPHWLLYGANGYTGLLVLAEALRRGLRPILAGRRAAEVEALAHEHGLPARSFDLTNAATLRAALDGASLVLHCAGPFSATCAPMLEACLTVGAHYVDITGEIDVFAHCHAEHARARQRGVNLVPGAGFDVVPTDSLAALLARDAADPRELVLAFEAGGGPSPGTARTSVEGLARGGRVRRAGALVDVPLAWKERTFLRDGVPRAATTIPWGDVYTAHLTTGAPDIEVYMAMPPATIARLRRWRWLAPLAGLGPLRRWLAGRAGAVRGPSDARRAVSGCRVWGELRGADGTLHRAELDTPNGYDVTAWCAVGIVERLLRDPPREGGYRTPSQLMGADWILSMPGVRLGGPRTEPATPPAPQPTSPPQPASPP